jgi:hypothetical protein
LGEGGELAVWKLSGDAECKLETLEETAREVIIRKEGLKKRDWSGINREKGKKRQWLREREDPSSAEQWVEDGRDGLVNLGYRAV